MYWVTGGYEVPNIYIRRTLPIAPFLFPIHPDFLGSIFYDNFLPRLKLDQENAKWVETARWRLCLLIVVTSGWTWMIKLWRTLTRTVALLKWDVRIELDCRVTRRKRLRQLIVAELTCSMTRDFLMGAKIASTQKKIHRAFRTSKIQKLMNTWSK
jgi:hypothetical protein